MKPQNLIFNTKAGQTPCFSFSDLEKSVHTELSDLYTNSGDSDFITFDYKVVAKKLRIKVCKLVKIIRKFMSRGIVRPEGTPEPERLATATTLSCQTAC